MTFCYYMCRSFEVFEVVPIFVSLNVCLFSVMFMTFSFFSTFRIFDVLFLLNNECFL